MLVQDQNFHRANKGIVQTALLGFTIFDEAYSLSTAHMARKQTAWSAQNAANPQSFPNNQLSDFINDPGFVVSGENSFIMIKKILTFLLLLTILQSSIAQIKLFNGKDLSGWKIHGTEKWFVENGKLVCESGPDKEYGYLVSEKDFKNFELTVEFKQESNGNSGVFFHCSVDGVKISGWQAEVAPLNKSTGGIYESYGREWLIKPDPEKEKFLKEGDWNAMVVRMDGNKVTTWLNGHEMVTLTDEKIGSAEGKIALQIHSGGGVRVVWRKVELTEL